MPFLAGLSCRACGHVHRDGTPHVCERCWGPLDAAYDLGAASRELRRALRAPPVDMWRYAALLPVEPPGAAGRGIGWTPLVRAERLGEAVGVGDLWLKDESANPTASFKDRVVAVALAKARAAGAGVAACASTGNLAASVAALAPRFGMRAVVIVPGGAPLPPLSPSGSPGADVVAVDGPYDAANRLSVELAAEHPDWAWVNVGLRSWYVEGGKTVAHEIAEQLGWEPPAHVVVPVASGALALAVHRGFAELAAVGLTDGMPALSVGQPSGCAPVADAFAAGGPDVAPVRPRTAVPSLAMGDPPDGSAVLEAVRRGGGAALSVAEGSVAGELRALAAAEGRATEAAGGVVVGAVRQLARSGLVGAGDRVVAVLTAGGGPPPGGSPPRRTAAAVVEPTVDAFERWWATRRS